MSAIHSGGRIISSSARASSSWSCAPSSAHYKTPRSSILTSLRSATARKWGRWVMARTKCRHFFFFSPHHLAPYPAALMLADCCYSFALLVEDEKLIWYSCYEIAVRELLFLLFLLSFIYSWWTEWKKKGEKWRLDSEGGGGGKTHFH